MKAIFEQGYITVTREPGDRYVPNESALLYRLKVLLQKQTGNHWVKVRMWKDGHLVDDTQHYLKHAKALPGNPLYIWDRQYASRNSAKDYNAGMEVVFGVETR